MTRAEKLAGSTLLWGTASLLVCCLILFIWFSGRGYDVTDDANALVWAANPFRYHYTLSEAGYLLHPLYLLAGGRYRGFQNSGTSDARCVRRGVRLYADRICSA